MSQVDSSSAKKDTEITLIDKLSRLSYQQTLKLLGATGRSCCGLGIAGFSHRGRRVLE